MIQVLLLVGFLVFAGFCALAVVGIVSGDADDETSDEEHTHVDPR